MDEREREREAGAGACLAAALSAQPFDGSEIFDGRSGGGGAEVVS